MVKQARTVDWWTKRKLYRLAYFLRFEIDDVKAVATNVVQVQSSRSGGKNFLEWAIDFRKCGTDHVLNLLDKHYMMPSNDYRPVPDKYKQFDRVFWRSVRKKQGLIEQGEWILERV